MSEQLEEDVRQVVRSAIAGGEDPADVADALDRIQHDLTRMQEAGL